MKKIIALFLSLLMVVSLVTPVAANSDITYNNIVISYNVTSNGEDVIYVHTGDEITIDVTMENITKSGENFNVESIWFEIPLQKDFFVADDLDESKISSPMISNADLVYLIRTKNYKANFNGSHLSLRSYKSGEKVGTFKATVTATEGQSVVVVDAEEIFLYDANRVKYSSQVKGLTVIIGDKPLAFYTVKYMSQGEEISSNQLGEGEITVADKPQVIPDKHRFKGWKCGETLYQPGEKFNLTEDTTFVAEWEKIPDYTLEFNTNGGTTLASKIFAEGTSVDLTQFTTTKANHTFEGWYTDEALTNKVTSVKLSANTTVYAKWKELPKYTLTFNTNGGSAVAPITNYTGTVVDLAGYTSSKANHTFEGWYSDASLTNKITSVTLSANTTVYAKWKELPKYTLTFNTNGGSAVAPITNYTGTVVDLAGYTSSKANHTFEGWYSDASLTNKITSVTLSANTTVYAKWKELPKYTLTFNTNGGTAVAPITNYTGTVVDLAGYTSSKANHTFEGWYSDASLTNKITSVTLNADTTVYAKFTELPKYTLTFNTNGGTAISPVTNYIGTVVDLAGYTSSKTNYTFEGWYTDEALTNKVTSVTLSANTTVYAKWKELPKYTLTFNTNGGTAISPVTNYIGTVVDLAGYTSSKTNYTFEGWYSDEALTNKVTSVTLTSNTTVYAKFTELPKYTLTFNTNGGSAINPVTNYTGTVVDLAGYTSSKANHTFEGWYTDEALTNKVTSVTLTANTTVYAKFTELPKYTLTFNTNGGTAVTPITNYTGTVVDLTGYTSSKTNYTFEGWYSDASLTNKITSVTLTANTTVYAKFTELPKYTLTFNTNGGSTIAPITNYTGTVVDLAGYTSSKSSHTFAGWYLDEALTTHATVITLNADTTVYAKWTFAGGGGGGGGVTKYTVTYKDADGNIIEKSTHAANATVDLSKIKPAKEGFVFEGWYSDEALTNKVISIKVTKNVVIYAKWVEEGEAPDYKPAILTDDHFAYIIGREGGIIAPESDITRAEVATIIYRLLNEDERNNAKTKENVFTDVNEGDWFNTAVSTLARLELVKGRTEDTFAPDAYITRAELATIFARMVEVEYGAGMMFNDVAGHWAESYIKEAATAGWIVGFDGLFRPDDNITRAEVMTLVNRVLNRLPESKEDLLEGMTTWVDNADENAWYYLYVQEATNSHDYEKKADKVHEKWTKLNENPNWAELEK